MGPLGEDARSPAWTVSVREEDGELLVGADKRVSLERGLIDAKDAIEAACRESVAVASDSE